MMNYEDIGNSAKNKATWFSAQDVCILADLVRRHSDALRTLSNSPSRNEKKKVWEIIAQLLQEQTNVPRTTRQVQKKWSNLRSAVRRASRTTVGTTVLPHYFLPVVKYLEEENALDGNLSQDIPEEEVDDQPQNLEVMQQSRRKTYAVKIKQIQEQQEAEVERFAVLKEIKLESAEENEEREIPDIIETTETQEQLQFSHVTLPDAESQHSDVEQLETNGAPRVWIHESCVNPDVVTEQTEAEVYFQDNQGQAKRNNYGSRKRLRPTQDYWEENTSGDEVQMKMELLRAQLLLVQKETSLKEKEIEKKDKEISLLDKEILKVDLEIKFMKRKHMWEERNMGIPGK